MACFPENKHLATREHDALGFDQLIETVASHSIWLPRAFHFMIMAHFPQLIILSLFWNLRWHKSKEREIDCWGSDLETDRDGSYTG